MAPSEVADRQVDVQNDQNENSCSRFSQDNKNGGTRIPSPSLLEFPSAYINQGIRPEELVSTCNNNKKTESTIAYYIRSPPELQTKI